MAEKFKDIFCRAYQDTKHFFGWKFRLLVFPLSFIIGSFIHYIRFGQGAFMDEWNVVISYGVFGVGLCTLMIFFYNIIKVPFKETTKRQWIMVVGFIIIGTLSMQLLPKIPIGNIFQNKEKEEVKLLIKASILDIDGLIRDNKEYLIFLKRIDSTMVDHINNKTFYDSVKLDELLKNKLLQKYSLEAERSLSYNQRNLREILKTLNGPDNKSKLKVSAFTPYRAILEIIKHSLVISMQLVDNEITESEFIEQSNKFLHDFESNLIKSGVFQQLE